MFFGQYQHSIDPKGRLTIPANYREQTADGVFVTEGFDHNLSVYSKDRYTHVANNLAKLSITKADTRDLYRKIFGRSYELNYDSAGRILIPAGLRQLAGLKDEVVIVGVGDIFELWSPSAWEAQQTRFDNPEADSGRWEAFDITTRGE